LGDTQPFLPVGSVLLKIPVRIPQHEKNNVSSLILEDADETIRPLIRQPGVSLPDQNRIAGLIRSYPNGENHDPTQRRNTLTFTAMPAEIPRLQVMIRAILKSMDVNPENLFDAIHLSILRSKDAYPSTLKLHTIFTDPRIIIHRLPDYGPMTR
jgi:hypothetical protein